LQNESKLFLNFIIHEYFDEYAVTAFTDENNDPIQVTNLHLYLQINRLLCLCKFAHPVAFEVCFQNMQLKFIDKINKYQNVINLINVALKTGSDLHLKSRLSKFSTEIKEIEHFNDNSVLVSSIYYIYTSRIVRWNYLYLKHLLEEQINSLSQNSEDFLPTESKKIKLHINPTQLTELVMALIENQNFKKQDYESEKKLYNYLYKIFAIKSHNFETTKTKLKNRQKTNTFLTELDRSFKTAVKKLKDKQD